MTALQHIIFSRPAFDRRDEPNGPGIASAEIVFAVRGPLGAIAFEIMTGWFPREIDDTTLPCAVTRGRGVQIGFHSAEPRTEARGPQPCDLLGAQCYHDSSYLAADEPFDILCREGLDALWAYLERLYHETFQPH